MQLYDPKMKQHMFQNSLRILVATNSTSFDQLFPLCWIWILSGESFKKFCSILIERSCLAFTLTLWKEENDVWIVFRKDKIFASCSSILVKTLSARLASSRLFQSQSLILDKTTTSSSFDTFSKRLSGASKISSSISESKILNSSKSLVTSMANN